MRGGAHRHATERERQAHQRDRADSGSPPGADVPIPNPSRKQRRGLPGKPLALGQFQRQVTEIFTVRRRDARG